MAAPSAIRGMPRKTVQKFQVIKQLQRRRTDILRAMERYGVDVKHAQDVRSSALQLFDSLKLLHRLPGAYREWLAAAAMLYEVGDYLNRSGRHRHAQYIIANSEILGYTAEQRRIIGAIARYLGKSRPTPGDGAMQGISAVDQEHVRKCSLLLRIARAINLGRSRSCAASRNSNAQRSGSTATSHAGENGSRPRDLGD